MKGLLKRRATAEESRARAFKREYDDLKDRLDSIRANYDNCLLYTSPSPRDTR